MSSENYHTAINCRAIMGYPYGIKEPRRDDIMIARKFIFGKKGGQP